MTPDQRPAPPETALAEIPIPAVTLSAGFWKDRQIINRQVALLHQWNKLEEYGSIDNFRAVAGVKSVSRRGYFYTDSDVHKWAEAAALALLPVDTPSANAPLLQLQQFFNEYCSLVAQAQTPDGYLFTYNQFHFPDRRWANLQIEHELYCMGHLIEAGVAHHLMTAESLLFQCARRAADLLVKTFLNQPPEMTPGHPEIELALIRLYRASRDSSYLELARQFLDRRGKIPLFGLKLLRQNGDQGKRAKTIQNQSANLAPSEGAAAHGDEEYGFMETTTFQEPPFIKLRAAISFLTGRYFQQHAPLLQIHSPVGHSVRWGYLMTAWAMRCHEIWSGPDFSVLSRLWDQMVEGYMYITGGVGSLPYTEGFGRRHELSNVYSYCETCAAIASIFWSWEMYKITHDPKYPDLIEWLLYNAVMVGISLDGNSYFYRNLLESDGSFRRKEWYKTPCCPSNISRLWGSLGKYVFSFTSDALYINQYISSTIVLPSNFHESPSDQAQAQGQAQKLKITSQLPWQGEVAIEFDLSDPLQKSVYLRIPGWASKYAVSLNGVPHNNFSVIPTKHISKGDTRTLPSAFRARFLRIDRTWEPNDRLSLSFPMEITVHAAHPKVKPNRGKIAITRGPLAYCLEEIDTRPEITSSPSLDPGAGFETIKGQDCLSEMLLLTGKSARGDPVPLIPYFAHANRQPSPMRVWVNTDSKF